MTIVSGVRFYGTEAGSAELGLMVVVNGNDVTEVTEYLNTVHWSSEGGLENPVTCELFSSICAR